MKEFHVLSWGGGTQSTALMLKMLKDKEHLDYIIFADTKNEPEMVYSQVYTVSQYVKKNYDKDIIVTARNKTPITDQEAINMIREYGGTEYRRSEYADLFQSHVLYFEGHLDTIDTMPFWIRNRKSGKIGKTPYKGCTVEYKIREIMRELRRQTGIKRFNPKLHKVYMYIGFSSDELIRSKPSPLPYVENVTPLIDMEWDKSMCIDYVEKELGFIPTSSVCNMCYANYIDRVYDVFKNDKLGWNKLLILDEAMRNKPETHKIKDDCFMFRWQAEENVRLLDLDFEQFYQEHKEKQKSRNLFDLEEEGSCMGGCFI